MVRATREELFGNASSEKNTEPSHLMPSMEFEDLNFRAAQTPAHGEMESTPDISTFQLFAGMDVAPVIIEEKEESEELASQRRPLGHYIYRSTPDSKSRAREAAISGLDMLQQARSYLATCKPVGEDVNAGWKPFKKPCRPGSSVRRAKRLKHRQRYQRNNSQVYRHRGK